MIKEKEILIDGKDITENIDKWVINFKDDYMEISILDGDTLPFIYDNLSSKIYGEVDSIRIRNIRFE